MSGNQKQSRLLNSFHKSRKSLVSRKLSELYREKENESQKQFNSRLPIKSDKKLVNFSEMVPNLLEEIRTKNNTSFHNNLLDNLSFSFGCNSNSSEIHDDNDSDNDNNPNIINRINSPKKNTLPSNINKFSLDKDDKKEFNLNDIRKIRTNENSPTLYYRKTLKKNKDSLILKLHKYFFQDGEMENIDTLIKYNLNKIKINDNNENKKDLNSNNDIDDFDYYNIKQEIINIMDEFSDSFDKENKELLISSIQHLRTFSQKYKFDYVTDLTSDWLLKMKDKKYDNCQLKYIGYYNQIRDIIEKMLKELKKKVDFILFYQERKNKGNQNINMANNIDNDKAQNIKYQKMNSINKEELLKTKEIKPIKIDIEVQNNLNLSEVEELLRNLDEGDLGNFGGKENPWNKKIFNKYIKIRSDNEFEAFSYPFKEDDLCHVF